MRLWPGRPAQPGDQGLGQEWRESGEQGTTQMWDRGTEGQRAARSRPHVHQAGDTEESWRSCFEDPSDSVGRRGEMAGGGKPRGALRVDGPGTRTVTASRCAAAAGTHPRRCAELTSPHRWRRPSSNRHNPLTLIRRKKALNRITVTVCRLVGFR